MDSGVSTRNADDDDKSVWADEVVGQGVGWVEEGGMWTAG